jgi:uncharacterized protein
VRIGASFGPRDLWHTGGLQDTPLGQRVLDDCSRFELEMATVENLPQAMQRLPLREFLQQGGYGVEFIDKVLVPGIGFLIVSDGVLDMPVEQVSDIFRHHFTFFSNKTWRRIEGGVKQYVSRLAARINAKVLLSTPVASVRRVADGVVVTSACGGEARYDEVIFATNASIARSVLADPAKDEVELLDTFRFRPTTVYLHGDQSVLSPHLPLGTAQYRYLGPHVGPVLRGTGSFMISPYAGLETPVITYEWENSEGPFPRRNIVTVVRWDHYASTPASFAAMRALHQIQGVRRTWFCGRYTTPLLTHEGAFISGMLVAEALGAAYPFANAPQAARHYAAVRKIMLPEG